MTRRLWLASLALVAASLAVALAALAANRGGPGMGPMVRTMRPAFHGYYDGHKDTFLSTDVSDRAQAREMHINFSAALAHAPMSATPEMYLFKRRAAARQLPVFASEPGESNYSPLWHEVFLTWKAGMTPTLLTSDTDIEAAVKAGKLREQETHIVLNCPIVKVGR
jgi:hypothetical protein